jgi:hypothetical protein
VYAIPLAAETVLRIRTGVVTESNEPEVTTWKLPAPSNVLAKWEGGVLASNGVMYCMPNNHKAVLQIVPYCLPSRESLHRVNDEREKEREAVREMEKLECLRVAERKVAERTKKREQRIQEQKRRIEKNENDDDNIGMKMSSMNLKMKKNEGENTLVTTSLNLAQSNIIQPSHNVVLDNDATTPYKYLSGIPTLRSSAHRVKYSLMHRQHNPNPKGKDGTSTNTTFLPAQLCEEDIFAYSTSEYDFHGALVDLLHRCDTTLVGNFRTLADGTSLKTLDNFVVPTNSLVRECQGGNLEVAQSYLSDVVDNDVAFLCLFDNFLVKKVLPRLKERLQSTGLHNAKAPISFFYQRPPTIRIQPGPARALVRAHNDAEYGREFLHTALFISLIVLECYFRLSHLTFPLPRSKWRVELLVTIDQSEKDWG